MHNYETWCHGPRNLIGDNVRHGGHILSPSKGEEFVAHGGIKIIFITPIKSTRWRVKIQHASDMFPIFHEECNNFFILYMHLSCSQVKGPGTKLKPYLVSKKFLLVNVEAIANSHAQ